MKVGEIARWLAALSGTFLWLVIPLIVWEGGAAKHLYRCRGRTFTGTFDDCFNDYIPVLEVVAIPLFTLLTVYFFARFAFTLYGPPPQDRPLRWRLSARGGARGAWPIVQILAVAGATWAIWRFSTYPLVRELVPFHLYWGGFAGWFATGAIIGIRDQSQLAPE